MGTRLKSHKISWVRTVLIISGLGISLATMASCGGSSMTPHQLIGIVVSPTGAGANQRDTVPFSATGTFAQPPTTQTNIPAQWASSDTATATIDPNTGAATCVAVGGPVTITASAAGARVPVSPSTALRLAAFSQSNNCGTSVAPGQSCNIRVSWSPKTRPDTGGPVIITDSDCTSPQTVHLPVFKQCNP
jgi:hypothetical protein